MALAQLDTAVTQLDTGHEDRWESSRSPSRDPGHLPDKLRQLRFASTLIQWATNLREYSTGFAFFCWPYLAPTFAGHSHYSYGFDPGSWMPSRQSAHEVYDRGHLTELWLKAANPWNQL